MKPRGPITPEALRAIGAGDLNKYLKHMESRPPRFYLTIKGEDMEFDGWRIEIDFDSTVLAGHPFMVWVHVRGSSIAFRHIDDMTKLMALYELWKGEPWKGMTSLFAPSNHPDKPVRITGDG